MYLFKHLTDINAYTVCEFFSRQMCEILKFDKLQDQGVSGIDATKLEEHCLSPRILEDITDAEFEDLMASLMNEIADIGSDRFQFLQELKASREEGKVKKVNSRNSLGGGVGNIALVILLWIIS